jgi:hypothetical protein
MQLHLLTFQLHIHRKTEQGLDSGAPADQYRGYLQFSKAYLRERLPGVCGEQLQNVTPSADFVHAIALVINVAYQISRRRQAEMAGIQYSWLHP